ncbi:preprotein translocase subunit YajC [Mollicutes bacterium LVI A0078]|nr:preprotein translocase subunit YajC [Mollicutes bacterium LVI A0075]WOO91074.1 preprotein translocase subunit YajC [Mollicutes bacterium LVI A0078]
MQLIFGLVIPFAFMFGVMYLLLIRPQNKRESARVTLVESLEKGDRIRTFGGIVGSITAINETSVVIRTGSSEIEILKEAVASKLD